MGKKKIRVQRCLQKNESPGTSEHIAHLRLGHCLCCFDHQVGSVGFKLCFGPLESESETTLCNPLGSTNGIMSYLSFSQVAALVQAHKHIFFVFPIDKETTSTLLGCQGSSRILARLSVHRPNTHGMFVLERRQQ